MKLFYVTFGMGSLFRGYYAIFEAFDEEVVAAYLARRLKLNYSTIRTSVPADGKPLRDEPEVLQYSKASHI